MSEKRKVPAGRVRSLRRRGPRLPPAMAAFSLGFLSLAAGGSQSAPAEGSKQAQPEVAWVKTYAADDDRWYRHQDLAFCPAGMTIGVLEEDHDPGAPPASRMWLYRVAADGSLVDSFEVPKPPPDAPGRPESVALPENMKVECGPDGGTVVAFNFPEGIPWLVRLDEEGAVSGSLRVGGPDSQMRLTDMVREPDGGYLLLGFGPEAAVALRLDSVGRVRSEIVRDYGYQDSFVGGCVREDGGLMLVANSQGEDPLAAGEPLVWLSAYDSGGKLVRETRSPGRFGALAAWSDAGGTLVYDRSTEGPQSIQAVAYDADLEPGREVEISDQGGTLALPYLAQAGRAGALFVLGNRWDHAQLTKIDAEGRRAWTVFGKDWGRSLDFQLGIGEDGDVYVLLSQFIQGNSGFRRKITLAKVAE